MVPGVCYEGCDAMRWIGDRYMCVSLLVTIGAYCWFGAKRIQQYDSTVPRSASLVTDPGVLSKIINYVLIQNGKLG